MKINISRNNLSVKEKVIRSYEFKNKINNTDLETKRSFKLEFVPIESKNNENSVSQFSKLINGLKKILKYKEVN